MKKKTLIIATAAILLITLFTPFAQASSDGQASSEMRLSSSPDFPESIVISGQNITVTKLPAAPDYRYILLYLKDAAGGSVVFDMIAERDRGGNAVFNAGSVPAGRYNAEIFHSAQEYSTYSGMLWGGDVQVLWYGYSGVFVESAMYAHNTNVSRGKRADLAALSYYLEPSPDIQSGSAAIRSASSRIVAGINDSYGKAMAIHDWVCDNIYYNHDSVAGRAGYGDYSAAGVLNSRRSVCEGYANLMAALLRAAGIPAKKVSGFATGGSTGGKWPQALSTDTINHSWNEAFVDGRWILIDATWDSGNDWEYGRVSSSGGLIDHRYFDTSQALFSADHMIADYSEAAVDRFANNRRYPAAAFAGRVRLNGSREAAVTVYTIEYSNYIKLRDLAALLSYAGRHFSVGWNSVVNEITVISGMSYCFMGSEFSGTPARTAASATIPAVRFSVDGKLTYISAFSINGVTYLKLRDAADIFGFNLQYDVMTNTLQIAA